MKASHIEYKIGLSPEFDNFGPWIYKIKNITECPKLFKPYYETFHDAGIVLKLPRNIERRMATPDMDLYDYVLAVNTTTLLILKREEDRVQSYHFNLSDICGIKHYHNLNDGLLSLYLSTSTFEIPFSTVSSDMIDEMISLMRKHMTHSTASLDFVTDISSTITEAGAYFFHILMKRISRTESSFKCLALHHFRPTEHSKYPLIDKILRPFNRFLERPTIANLLILTPYELISVIHHEGKLANYSYDISYLPYVNMENIRAYDANEDPALCHLMINAKGQVFKLDFNSENNLHKKCSQTLRQIISSLKDDTISPA